MIETTSTASEYLDALASFERAADRLAATDPVMLSPQEMLQALHRLETAARKIPYSQHLLARVAFEQGLPGQLDYTGLKEMLVDQLRLAGSEARDRMRGAVDRAPRHERGTAPEPKYALIAAAQRTGRISERHATAMDKIFTACRTRLTATDAENLEDILVTAAHDVTPDDLITIGRRAIDLLDPDGAEPDADVIARARALDVGPQGDHMMTDFDGALSPEGRALLDTILEKLARPGMNNPADADDPVRGGARRSPSPRGPTPGAPAGGARPTPPVGTGSITPTTPTSSIAAPSTTGAAEQSNSASSGGPKTSAPSTTPSSAPPTTTSQPSSTAPTDRHTWNGSSPTMTPRNSGAPTDRRAAHCLRPDGYVRRSIAAARSVRSESRAGVGRPAAARQASSICRLCSACRTK
ncbi:DUF222 domain-containing protein [Tsukamurella strandjordii]|uniref:DUF222 domain-containing protein n=1 Tax=Tsukamurella strandjordii TaxID=147577 RepID=A0AA90S7G6_9ACTN|nr:DUF222 domain-containing protein [Tsukamurella strandjordii]MDP0397235.1 DUF222 domain-containing protein [Tsukamurella strandjordii]